MSGALPTVAAFTDSYLPTVNGVTYTVSSWHEEYQSRDGRMPVVYPKSSHTPGKGEHPVSSLPFPFYDGYRMALPSTPDAVRDADVVHAHTPFGLGLAGLRLARRSDTPLVATYHTPTAEYAEYVGPDALTGVVRAASERYERWFLGHADLVLCPSERTCETVRALGVDTPVEVMPNGVDTQHFRPTDPTAFLSRHDLPTDEPLVGYTGRHGYEKRLSDLLAAAEDLDVTVVFGGDGPARDDLEAEAAERDVDARFLGFLDRDELPAFYSALDAFAFPSPVETEGLVALEANACGTPVAGVDAGALSETILDGETGYHYGEGSIPGFRRAIRRTLDDCDRLAENCLARREEAGVGRAIDRLAARYRDLL
ncbi:glycosyltransferase [Halobacterium jilantaiense]|uniref:Glycosyltransferase involved in cell wall bisynthesis n=1 Tax=Halobacterium jilantaiense TaxID=355548 RepID=A0A1I0NK46_9EURY|nr:glycosyltransferase [Halobacterium jilantaiense]SEW01770.1 Glycosyltransferase involved in cell wall bisynthesis [Halobacterium jilantaiense]